MNCTYGAFRMNDELLARHGRTICLIGEDGFDKLRRSVAAVVGLGGVGGYAAEALARSGVQTLVLIDGDAFDPSNLNRQIFATQRTVGRLKAEAAREKLLDIDPSLNIHARAVFFTKDEAGCLLMPKPDVIVDAIDAMAHKLDLIEYAHNNGIPVVSAGGAGNRLSPAGMRCADVYDTSGDPLCRIMRRELKKRGVSSHRVVYVPGAADISVTPPGSMAFTPGCMGLMLAHEAVRMLLEGDDE